jgi:hypothetical protein
VAQVVYVHFKGGPENGLEQTWTIPPPLPKALNWGGDIYDLVSQTGDQVTYRFSGQATKFAAGGLTAVTAMWTRLMRTLAHTGPRQLHRMHASTTRVRSMTRNHR